MSQDFGKFIQQAQNLERKMQAAQDKIANQELSGESGAGLVKMTMNGHHEAKKIEIDDSLLPGLSAENKVILQDLITAAINNANNKIKTLKQSTLPTGTDVLGLGNLFKER